MQSFRQPFPVSARAWLWLSWLGLFAGASILYLLDAHAQRFETLPLFRELRDALAPAAFGLPAGLRFWLADTVWAGLAALLAAELLEPAPLWRRMPVILLVACSWELLQAVNAVRGTFDPIDLVFSLAAGAVVAFLYQVFVLRSSPR